MTRKEGQRHNTGLAKLAVQFSASTFVVKSSPSLRPKTLSVSLTIASANINGQQ